MPGVVINSGFATSSAFACTRATFALYLPNSVAGTTVRVAFAPVADATSAQYALLQGENTGAPLVVMSGGGAGGPIVSGPIPAVMPFARIVLAAATTAPASYVVLPLTQ
jgi:hypothetical protein